MKNLMREAKIAVCKCTRQHDTYGVRFEKKGDEWEYSWAFPVSKRTAARERYDETKMVGNIRPTDDYPGCPFCGNKFFVICECGRLNCYNGKDRHFVCEWCNSSGELTVYTGEGFKSGGDI